MARSLSNSNNDRRNNTKAKSKDDVIDENLKLAYYRRTPYRLRGRLHSRFLEHPGSRFLVEPYVTAIVVAQLAD